MKRIFIVLLLSGVALGLGNRPVVVKSRQACNELSVLQARDLTRGQLAAIAELTPQEREQMRKDGIFRGTKRFIWRDALRRRRIARLEAIRQAILVIKPDSALAFDTDEKRSLGLKLLNLIDGWDVEGDPNAL